MDAKRAVKRATIGWHHEGVVITGISPLILQLVIRLSNCCLGLLPLLTTVIIDKPYNFAAVFVMQLLKDVVFPISIIYLWRKTGEFYSRDNFVLSICQCLAIGRLPRHSGKHLR